jgi:hypothetical protein
MNQEISPHNYNEGNNNIPGLLAGTCQSRDSESLARGGVPLDRRMTRSAIGSSACAVPVARPGSPVRRASQVRAVREWTRQADIGLCNGVMRPPLRLHHWRDGAGPRTAPPGASWHARRGSAPRTPARRVDSPPWSPPRYPPSAACRSAPVRAWSSLRPAGRAPAPAVVVSRLSGPLSTPARVEERE